MLKEIDHTENTNSLFLQQKPFDYELHELLQPYHSGKQTSLLLINTRLWVDELSHKYAHPVTIDTIPMNDWKEITKYHHIIWLMGIFVPSDESKNHARQYAYQYIYALPDLHPDSDIVASPFAIVDYSPNPSIVRDWKTWDKITRRLRKDGKKVYVDFIPNHTAIDHPWATMHPEYYIRGNKQQYEANPSLFKPVLAHDGQIHYLAHGKDPNYPEWSDTLQLNYANPSVQEAMKVQILQLVEHADGVRCDMAMLVNPSTFLRTWGWLLSDDEKTFISQHDFWPSIIPLAKQKAKQLGLAGFDFMAEAYWEKDILKQTFDSIYRDELYKHIRNVAQGRASMEDLRRHIAYLISNQDARYRDVLYLENHDEERAAAAMGKDFSRAAAALIGFLPGTILMLNHGQNDGRTIRPPMQIQRSPMENPDKNLYLYYERLLQLKQSRLFQTGNWRLAEICTHQSAIITLKVESPDNGVSAILCINMSHQYADCTLPEVTRNNQVRVNSISKDTEINPDMIRSGGMYVGLDPYEFQIVYFDTQTRISP